MKRILSLLLILTLSMTMIVSALADDGDEFDLSAETAKVEELGVPTKKSVAALKKEADDLWDAKDYEKAADAYAKYAKQANWLANIIASIDDPYYSGDSDERKYFYNNSMYDTAASAENTANSYKNERNRAMTREALCYYYLGNYTAAVPLLIKALDLIEIDDSDNWKLCADAINDIISK